MVYTSWQRLSTALEHREPDRVPFDLGGALVTGINVNALRELRTRLDLRGDPEVLDQVTQIADTGDDVRSRLRADVESVRPVLRRNRDSPRTSAASTGTAG